MLAWPRGRGSIWGMGCAADGLADAKDVGVGRRLIAGPCPGVWPGVRTSAEVGKWRGGRSGVQSRTRL